MKDSPASLISGAGTACTYDMIIPNEYISLESITYEIKEKEGRIQNISLRDKKEKLKLYSPTWMVRQLWKHPEMGTVQLKGYTDNSYQEPIDETLIRDINELEEEEALWFL